MTTHRIDYPSLTVLAIDEHGEAHDLNAEGLPCRSANELRDFVIELGTQGAYGIDTELSLLEDVDLAAELDADHDCPSCAGTGIGDPHRETGCSACRGSGQLSR